MKIPKNCKDCNCLGDYTKGPFRRNPHYCCELIWDLYEEDYRVNPDVLDENCPKKKMNEVLDKLFDNVTPFKQVVKSDKDIYYIDYSKHETTTGNDSSSVTTVIKSPDEYIMPEETKHRKQRGRTAPSRGKE